MNYNLLTVVSDDRRRDWNIGVGVREDGDVVVTLFQSDRTHFTDWHLVTGGGIE